MKRAFFSFSLALSILSAAPSLAQAPGDGDYRGADRPVPAPIEQEACITVMAGLPNDDPESRYQFLKLSKDLSQDASPAFQSALHHYGQGPVSFDTPVLDVIETIANPVIRQAAPAMTISYMAYMIDFYHLCGGYIDGQIGSLATANAALSEADINIVIAEDALYMRQILMDALYRQGAQDDPVFAPAVQTYANRLVVTRNQIEFTGFDHSVDDIEASFMRDLDGRLARSNDIINEEMDREVLSDSIELADDMNDDVRRKRQQEEMRTLYEILNRYGRVRL